MFGGIPNLCREQSSLLHSKSTCRGICQMYCGTCYAAARLRTRRQDGGQNASRWEGETRTKDKGVEAIDKYLRYVCCMLEVLIRYLRKLAS